MKMSILRLMDRDLGEATFPLLKQSKSVITYLRGTLEDQVLSTGQDRAFVVQQGGLL